MEKFKVGDKVWCFKKNKYNITDYHVPCVILSTSPFVVKVLSSGFSFCVNKEHFEKIPRMCIRVV